MTAAEGGKTPKNEPVDPEASTPAERALAEAEARRKQERDAPERPKEEPARKGLEPTRYGDWEKKGITSDF
jgi:hypothetical protein